MSPLSTSHNAIAAQRLCSMQSPRSGSVQCNRRAAALFNKPHHPTASSRSLSMISRNYNLMAPAKALKDGDGACLLKPKPKGGFDVTSN
jgi:hypothetical protein